MSGGGKTLTYTIDNISTHLHLNAEELSGVELLEHIF